MILTWEAVATLCVLVGLVAAGLALYVRLSLTAALMEFEHRFFERLNGRYIKSELCKERHHEVDRRVQALERVLPGA